MKGNAIAFPDEYLHLETYFADFFPFLSGAFDWSAQTENWQEAVSALSATWHLVNIQLGKCGLCEWK